MSRVGKKPIPIPDGVQFAQVDRQVTIQGKNGTLTREIHPAVALQFENGALMVTPQTSDRRSIAIQGLERSLLANMVEGVSKGFERVLEIHGIGYRAELKDNAIVFNIGYSHPIHFPLPDAVSATIEKNNIIKLTGIDKELLGHTAAAIRRLRPPEPYKGKGIKFAEERIQRKAGKAGTK